MAGVAGIERDPSVSTPLLSATPRRDHPSGYQRAVAQRTSQRVGKRRVVNLIMISLTFTALNQTTEAWFLVSGAGKAEAVARALAPEGSVHETPARGITTPNRTWWLDQAAASRL